MEYSKRIHMCHKTAAFPSASTRQSFKYLATLQGESSADIADKKQESLPPTWTAWTLAFAKAPAIAVAVA